jgi:predicted adenine nucleotide alpha hydrolase (AANH) superfamily ATPase
VRPPEWEGTIRIGANFKLRKTKSSPLIPMKNYFLLAVVLLPLCCSAQRVAVVDYATKADVKVYEVSYASSADLKVFKEYYSSKADKNEGRWYFGSYESTADKKIFFVDYASQADIKIFYVDYESQAGWVDESKKHLME